MLDYGYRSRCCKAPIKLGVRKNKVTGITKKVWICVRCNTSDVGIIAKNLVNFQPFAEQEPQEESGEY